MRFWGVRGSIACPGPETARYGGNTACVEMRCGAHVLTFDGGTGLRPHGKALAAEGALDGDVFLTHTHFDHIIGIPFFAPAFDARSRFRIWAGHLMPHGSNVCDVLRLMMRSPLFPVPVEIFKAEIEYCDFGAGEVLTPRPGITVRTAPLDHPDGATGYRVEFAGRSACYVTDTNHVPGTPRSSTSFAGPTWSSTTRPSPTPSTSAMPAGDTPPGRKACASATQPAPASW